jgi:imidazolonepropionase-like amidohydrolase
LIDEPTAKILAERRAFLVPTLVTYDSMARKGKELGMPEANLAKNKKVLDRGLRSLEICKSAGVELGFGSDLLGFLHDDQSREFSIRAEVLSPAEIIRSATLTNARILQKEGELGVIRPGAFTDLLVIEGDPVGDLGLLQNDGRHLAMIMKGGKFYKRCR